VVGCLGDLKENHIMHTLLFIILKLDGDLMQNEFEFYSQYKRWYLLGFCDSECNSRLWIVIQRWNMNLNFETIEMPRW